MFQFVYDEYLPAPFHFYALLFRAFAALRTGAFMAG
jgi:hypothetical protein